MSSVRYKPGEAVRWLESGAADSRKSAARKTGSLVRREGARSLGTDVRDAAGALVDLGKSALSELMHRQATASEFMLHDDHFEVASPGRLRAVRYDAVRPIRRRGDRVNLERPLREILFADYAYLNADLAKHYALAGSELGDALQRVDNITAQHRGGLLGLGALLTATSAPLRTSPVKRGDWILRRVLGTPVPPPPANAGSIAADESPADNLSVRQRLEAHRREPACVNCHSRIDPLGFALEHYDSLGRWRETYRNGDAIDDALTLSSGRSISGKSGLQDYLREHEQDFYRMLCTKLLAYALGRSELASDRDLMNKMTAHAQRGDGRLADLVVDIVTSPQFRRRRAVASLAASPSVESSHGSR